jgi:hypothetical protein
VTNKKAVVGDNPRYTDHKDKIITVDDTGATIEHPDGTIERRSSDWVRRVFEMNL